MSLPQHIFRTGIGQDSHRFLEGTTSKPFVIGGITLEGIPGMDADSDGDVVFHSLCNAITSLTGLPILGGVAIDLCHKEGITDSQIYLEKALASLQNQKIVHIAFSIEGKRPRLQKKIPEIQKNIAAVTHISFEQVGITITSGDELSDFGRGMGLQCFCILTTVTEHRLPETR